MALKSLPLAVPETACKVEMLASETDAQQHTLALWGVYVRPLNVVMPRTRVIRRGAANDAQTTGGT